MSLAVAFYDEAPDWYELVAGRYFQEFLPNANAMLENGFVSQGTSTYAPIKLHVQLWAAYLIKVCTGENPLTEDVKLGMQFLAGHTMPNGSYFQTGDGNRYKNGIWMQQFGHAAEYFVAAALYNDAFSLAWVKNVTEGYDKYCTDSIFTMTPDLQLLFISAVTAEKVGHDSLDTIQYFADPAGYMMARNSWDEDAVAVLMKLGNKTTVNHDIYDHGTFQIYYNGLLAGSSGLYKKYGSVGHTYYLRSTVAHNGLLIFNPSKSAPMIKEGDEILNPSVCFYSGSQKMFGEAPESYLEWNDDYRTAETVGSDWGYYSDGSAKYAYIAGDLTTAYPDDTVDYVGRRMFTLFTGNEDIPMVFLTFDEMTSDEDYYEKTFLLHTVNEPTVDEENMTAEIKNGGRLVLKSLLGADVIEKVGGEGHYFWINGHYKEDGTYVEGVEAVDKHIPEDYGKEYWGRVQLRRNHEKASALLTAMYVTEGKSTATLDIEGYKSGSIYTAIFDGNAVSFYAGRDKAYEEFSFETEGKGLYNYYVSGIADGTWRVTVDGVSVAYTLSSDNAGMLTFIAPAGKVTLTPGKDVTGANGGNIVYSGGAVLPEDAPYTYRSDEQTLLPETATRGNDTFLGWYLTSECLPEDRVYEVPYGYTGTFRVYAKWLLTYVDEDYSGTDIDISGTVNTVNGIYYHGENKNVASFKTKTDKNGINYLEWIKGSQDPHISVTSTTENISTSTADDKTISYTLEFSANEGSSYMTSIFYIIAKQNVSGTSIASQFTTLFKTDNNGQVTLGSGNDPIGIIYPNVATTVRIAVDFKNGKINAYNAIGDVIASEDIQIPAVTGAQTTEEFMKCFTEYLGYWYAYSSASTADATMRIYSMKIEEGNAFKDLSTSTASSIIYNTNGGSIPKDAPVEFSKTEPTLLPSDVTRDGYIFGGWYTTPSFEEGTRTYYVPADTDHAYVVYAKWLSIITNEDFENTDVAVGENTEGVDIGAGKLSYNAGSAASPKPGSSFYTKEDTNGNIYLEASVGGKDATIYKTSTKYNLTTFSDTAISYKIDFKKLAGVTLPDMSISIPTRGNANGSLGILKMDNIGNMSLDGSTKVFATVGEDSYTTIRVTVDFAASTITAYDEFGAVLDMVTVTTMPAEVTTLLEWQKVAAHYLMNINLTNPSKASEIASFAIDNIIIEEGRKFVQEDRILPFGNDIIYKPNGGKLENAPTEYDLDIDTDLNDIVPERYGYDFDGWYTTEECTPESRVYSIPHDSVGTFVIYAKWVVKSNTIYVELDGGTLNTKLPDFYDKENGTDLTAFVPEKYGYTFEGWYTNDTFEGVPVTIIGKDGQAPITLYAKWTLRTDFLFFELKGGTLANELPDFYDKVNGTDLTAFVPTKEGCEFAGWYTSDTFDGEPVTIIGKDSPAPITLYVKWIIAPEDYSNVTTERVTFA